MGSNDKNTSGTTDFFLGSTCPFCMVYVLVCVCLRARYFADDQTREVGGIESIHRANRARLRLTRQAAACQPSPSDAIRQTRPGPIYAHVFWRKTLQGMTRPSSSRRLHPSHGATCWMADWCAVFEIAPSCGLFSPNATAK